MANCGPGRVVGEPGVGVALGGPGEQDLGAERGQPALDAHRDRVAQVGVDGVARIEDDDLVGDAGLQLGQRDVLAQAGGVAARDGAHEPVEGAEGVGSAGAVGGDADALLELAQRCVGLHAEQAVGPAGGEAEGVQAPLQLGDVVAGHEVAGDVGEHAVAELPARLLEAPEGVRPDDPVDGDPALLLEGAHGTIELVVEVERITGGDVAAQRQVGQA